MRALGRREQEWEGIDHEVLRERKQRETIVGFWDGLSVRERKPREFGIDRRWTRDRSQDAGALGGVQKLRWYNCDMERLSSSYKVYKPKNKKVEFR